MGVCAHPAVRPDTDVMRDVAASGSLTHNSNCRRGERLPTPSATVFAGATASTSSPGAGVAGETLPCLVLASAAAGRCVEKRVQPCVPTQAQVSGCGHSGKKFCAFLCHHKRECAMEARFLKCQLEAAIGFGSEVFLDSDDLQDMRLLLGHVRDSDCLVLLQSAEVLTRPWCILELCTAIEAAVPIVAVCVRGKGFDFADSLRCLTFLDKELDRRNPGASEHVRSHGLTPLDAAYLLSNVIPNLVAVEINPSASKNVLLGSLADLVDQVRNASPVLISTSKLEWLESRDALLSAPEHWQHGRAPDDGSSPPAAISVPASASTSRKSPPVGRRQTTATAGRKKVSSLAPIPRSAPPLPKAYFLWPSVENATKKALFSPSVSGRLALLIRGPSGCGKTVLACMVARDHDVRSHFEKICFLSMGRNPDMARLQIDLYEQLTNRQLDAVALGAQGVEQALQEAATRSHALVIIDDAMGGEQVQSLCCWLRKSDHAQRASSCTVVTTRTLDRVGLQAAVELPLGPLEPDAAVSFMLESAGSNRQRACCSPLAHKAASICGRMPLALSIAAGMLEQMGGVVDEAFVARLQEHEQEPRDATVSSAAADEASTGDVAEEDSNAPPKAHLFANRIVGASGVNEVTENVHRIAASSLRHYCGEHSEAVQRLFHAFAVFPDDVVVPVTVFEVFAVCFRDAGDTSFVRSCLAILLRLGLIQGSLTEGLYQHRSLRDLAVHGCGKVKVKDLNLAFVETLLSSRPSEGWPSPSLFMAGVSSDSVGLGSRGRTANWYVAEYAWWHIRGALQAEASADSAIQDDAGLVPRLISSDASLAEACVVGLGQKAMLERADVAERAGEVVIAAKLLRACALASAASARRKLLATMVEDNPVAMKESELLLRAQRLLQDVSDATADVGDGESDWGELEQLELEILGRLVMILPEGVNGAKARTRRHNLVLRRRDSGGETPEDALLDSLTYCADAGALLGCFEGKLLGKKIDMDQVDRAIELWISSARRCADAAKLAGDFDQGSVRVARFVGVHHLATMWGLCSRAFMDSGIIDELGGPARLVETVRLYDHRRDHDRFYNFQNLNVLIDGLHVHSLLSMGYVGEAIECVEKLIVIWETASASETRGVHAHELWLCCQSLLPALVRLQVRQAHALGQALRLLKWNSSTCRIVWDQAVRNSAGALGGESNSFVILQMFLNLQAFVIDSSVASLESVRATLEARELLIESSDTSWDLLVLEWAMLETAALAAEKLGDDSLADFYVECGLERYAGFKVSAQASLLALRARISDRAGRASEALSFRKRAVALAIDAAQPLQALCVATKCPKADCEVLISKVCEAIGRPHEQVMREFAQHAGKLVL